MLHKSCGIIAIGKEGERVRVKVREWALFLYKLGWENKGRTIIGGMMLCRTGVLWRRV